eukprot:m.120204 g.120204  ORF g.120204 m.120204 type:complete len:61 (+) comp13683_c0_seq34:1231-1413(+)
MVELSYLEVQLQLSAGKKAVDTGCHGTRKRFDSCVAATMVNQPVAGSMRSSICPAIIPAT